MAVASASLVAETATAPDEVAPHRLYIGGLASNVTSDELAQRFRSFGNIVSTELLKDRNTGVSQGY